MHGKDVIFGVIRDGKAIHHLRDATVVADLPNSRTYLELHGGYRLACPCCNE
jgi:hypothetical protein